MTWGATAVAVGVANIGVSLIGGASAKKRATAAAHEQADLTFKARQEEIRQAKGAAAQEHGTAVAIVGASNIRQSGSTERFIEALDYENMREIAFATRAAEMERSAIRKGAAGAGASLFGKAAGDALGLAANLFANRSLANAPTTYVPNTPQTTGAPASLAG